jgi:hypothetical protein
MDFWGRCDPQIRSCWHWEGLTMLNAVCLKSTLETVNRVCYTVEPQNPDTDGFHVFLHVHESWVFVINIKSRSITVVEYILFATCLREKNEAGNYLCCKHEKKALLVYNFCLKCLLESIS